jgi:predicted dehydrogenase
MRVGVVGCGYWGSKHVRVLSSLPQVEQVVIVDSRQARREDLLRAFPAATAAASLREALPRIDALVIATPPASHATLALEAFEAGKHVLVEKPMATVVSDARQMIDAAAAAGVVLMAGHTFEYNAAVWALRDAVRAGTLGDVYYLDSARLNLGLYQSDVNVLWDLAPHDVSIFNHVLATTPDTVSAWGASHANTYFEDVAYVRLGYKEVDVAASLHVSWLDPCKVRRVTVVGSRQMAVYNDMSSEEKLRIYDKGVATCKTSTAAPPATAMHDIPVTYRYGGITSPYLPVNEPLAVQDQHFVDCVASGRRPDTDGESGLAVVQVLAAADLSLREQRSVTFDEVGV